MESKHRSSLDDYSSAASSIIRRMTQNSTQRLTNLRRPTSPSSAAPAVSTTIVPATNDMSVSCVSRETVHNECGLHRFIVWVAVKRNSCRRMTPDERRECPLLRCRKRFANHELMLQHLYTCDQLTAGEYWCYDCEKVELFNDAKCRQCLGHPSKRRKIMTMARNFFGSLGHKSRNGHISHTDFDLDLDLDLDLDQDQDHNQEQDDAPPSYTSILEPSQPELFSTEIHEMSSEAPPVSAASLEAALPQPTPAQPVPPTFLRRAPSRAVPAIQAELEPVIEFPTPLDSAIVETAPVSPVELDSVNIEDALINWEPSPTPSPTINSGITVERARTITPDKPVLQLHTHGLGQYRVIRNRSKKSRSKILAPSSSVRSTCSTTSNCSTVSTASYEVTPMSAWSGTWNRGQGFDSTLTSPDDLVIMDDLLPSETSAVPDKLDGIKEKDSRPDNLDCLLPDLPELPELPADLPLLSPFPKKSMLLGPLEMDQSVFSFDAAVPTELSIETNLALTDSSNMSMDLSDMLAQPNWNHYVNAHALVESARDTLHMHLAESLPKLKQVNHSHLAHEFRQMSPDAVALAGLKTMYSILEGSLAFSPVDILCFIHLVYSLSVIIHEQDAPSRWKDFFLQAMSYGAWVPQHDMSDYFHLVQCLWRPPGIDNNEVNILLQSSAPIGLDMRTGGSENTKGKQPQRSIPAGGSDAFACVSQIFLDELEFAVLQEVDRPDIQASELSVQHMKDATHQPSPGSPLSLAVAYMLRVLCQQYTSAPGYVTALKQLLDRVELNCITLRRLELELLHTGRVHLSPEVFFNHYVVTIRTQIDSLHAQTAVQSTPRLVYYQQGIQLLGALFQGSVLPSTMWENPPVPMDPSYHSLDQFFGSIPPSIHDNLGLDLPATGSGHVPIGVGPVAAGDMPTDTPNLVSTQFLLAPDAGSSVGGPSAAAPSPASSAHGSSPTKLVEADSCCEICGYRPKGDPRWFPGSMAKHKKLQHATSPPKIYRCPFPGCTSQYKNRPDNLRQHQIDKGHFVEGQDDARGRPNKRKRAK